MSVSDLIRLLYKCGMGIIINCPRSLIWIKVVRLCEARAVNLMWKSRELCATIHRAWSIWEQWRPGCIGIRELTFEEAEVTVCIRYLSRCNKLPRAEQLKTCLLSLVILKHAVSVGQESGRDLAGSSHSFIQGVSWAVSPSGGVTRGGSTSELPQVVGGIWFLVAVEMCRTKRENRDGDFTDVISEKKVPPFHWANEGKKLELLRKPQNLWQFVTRQEN